MDLEYERRIHRKIRVPTLLPGINALQGMEADLEEMGTAASQVLPLPCQY
jgi:hypothetical protein